MKASISLGAALAGIAFASPVWQDTSSYVRETHPVPRQFTWESDAPQDHMLQLSIALKQSRFEELDRLLYEGKLRGIIQWVRISRLCRMQCPTQTTTAMASI